MSGINNNRVNAVMTSDQLANVKTLFAAIQAQLPFLVGLSPAERVNLPKINVSNKALQKMPLMPCATILRCFHPLWILMPCRMTLASLPSWTN